MPCRTWAVLLLAPTTSGCATIFGQATQVLQVRTEPAVAEVSITSRNGTEVWRGTSPCPVPLRAGAGFFRGERYTITASKDGQSATVVVDTIVHGGPYVLGNLIFGGLIGWLIVDPASGAMWYLPSEVVINTDANQRGLVKNKSSLISLKSNESLNSPVGPVDPAMASISPTITAGNESDRAASGSITFNCRTLDEWNMPYGIGRIVVVDPFERSSETIGELGKQLASETASFRRARCLVYDDERAASFRMNPDVELSPDDVAFCDLHFIGTYVRDDKARTNVFHAVLDEASRKPIEIEIK